MPRIGSKDYPNVFLAPLSGCSDLAFRLIAREHGANLCFFEMVDANSLTHGKRTKSLSSLKTLPEDVPIAAQILGRDPDMMLSAARRIFAEAPAISFLDINAACPVRKVIKKKAGAYLLLDEKELIAIVKRLAMSMSIPITVKMRTGYDRKNAPAIAKLAKRCEENGASALFIHARTRDQGYLGECDYESIKEIKESVNIPVYGSGGIFTPQDARRMLDETGCDGILVARGALGNPWIFNEIKEYLNNKRDPSRVSSAVRKDALKRHLSYIERHKECAPSGKIGCMRKVFLWYTKGVPNAKRLREKVTLVKSYDRMIELAESL